MNNSIPFANWTWPTPMQITVTNPNFSYQTLARDFIEKYANQVAHGLTHVNSFYDNNAQCSIHLHQNNLHHLHEVIGHANWTKKLNELGIYSIKYHSLMQTPQPLGKKSILVNFHGQAEINGKNYNVTTSFIVKLFCGLPRITNHTFDIFV